MISDQHRTVIIPSEIERNPQATSMNTDADTKQIPLPMGTMCVNAFNAYMSQFATQLATSAGIDSFLLPVFVKAPQQHAAELKKKSAADPKEKPLIKLPWDGKNHEDQCQALVYNGGLYTQCLKARDDCEFCKTCTKQVALSGNGLPPHGHIHDRMAVGPMEFNPMDAAKPLKYYANVVGIGTKTSEAQVREQLERFGVRAEDWMFQKAPSTRKKATKVKTANKAETEQDDQIDSLLATVANDAVAAAATPPPPTRAELFSPTPTPTPPKVSTPNAAAAAAAASKTSTPYNSDDDQGDDDYDVDDDKEYPHWMTQTDMDEYDDWELDIDAKGGKKYDVNTRTHKVYKVDTHAEVKLFAYKNEDGGLKITKTKKKE